MQAVHEPGVPELSSGKSAALVVAALVIALLGLTVLDVAPSGGSSHLSQVSQVARDSVDCIVASAVFAGVSSPATMP